MQRTGCQQYERKLLFSQYIHPPGKKQCEKKLTVSTTEETFLMLEKNGAIIIGRVALIKKVTRASVMEKEASENAMRVGVLSARTRLMEGDMAVMSDNVINMTQFLSSNFMHLLSLIQTFSGHKMVTMMLGISLVVSRG